MTQDDTGRRSGPSRRVVGAAIIILGLALLIASAGADVLGYGVGTFGWKQQLGLVVGIVIAVVGFWLFKSTSGNRTT